MMQAKLLWLSFLPSLALIGSPVSHEINWWGLGSKYTQNPALGWQFVTFFIFIGLIYKFANQPLKAFLQARASMFKASLEQSNKALKTAELNYLTNQLRLESLDKEIKDLLEQFNKQAKSEAASSQQILQEALNRIRKETNESLSFELAKVKKEIAADFIKKALVEVRKVFQNDNPKYFEPYLKQVFCKELRQEQNVAE